jgi:hypothetical protein
MITKMYLCPIITSFTPTCSSLRRNGIHTWIDGGLERKQLDSVLDFLTPCSFLSYRFPSYVPIRELAQYHLREHRSPIFGCFSQTARHCWIPILDVSYQVCGWIVGHILPYFPLGIFSVIPWSNDALAFCHVEIRTRLKPATPRQADSLTWGQ